MGSGRRLFALGLMTLGVSLAARLARATDVPMPQWPAGASAASDDGVSEAIAESIRALGSGSFAAREQAGHRLIELGIAAREALLAAGSAPDAEVRVRARAIMATVFEADFRSRLEAFAADYDCSRGKTLPGWEPFSANFGSTGPARQLFVEMQRAEPELLEALVKGDKQASEALDARCRMVVQQAIQNPPGTQISLGTATSLLLVGSSAGVTIDEQVGSQLFPWIIYQPAFQKAVRETNRAAMLKKMLGQWIQKDLGPASSAENLKFAAQFDLKAEGLSLATRLLNDDDSPPTSRASALLLVGKVGGHEHLPLVEKSLIDKSNCGVGQLANTQRQAELQVRDVALAVAVRLTDQKLRDFGFLNAQPHPTTLYQVASLTFASPEVREAAFRKWGRWRAEHPN